MPASSLSARCCCASISRHARKVEAPILDLDCFSLPHLSHERVGGFFFRAGVGAIPFVLPMMLQVGFGLTPFESGSLTFASAAGALCMKFTAPPILRRFGFRRVLVSNAVISAASSSPRRRCSRRTTLASRDLRRAALGRLLPLAAIHEPQRRRLRGCAASRDEPRLELLERVAAALGIGRHRLRGHWCCKACRRWRGDHDIHVDDFKVAFVLVRSLRLSSVLMNFRLPRNAGNEVSGYGTAVGQPPRHHLIWPFDGEGLRP